MKFIQFFTVCLAALFAATALAQTDSATDDAATVPQPTDDVRIGEPAPDFELLGLNDKSIRLSDYQVDNFTGKPAKNVVLVFVRAHW